VNRQALKGEGQECLRVTEVILLSLRIGSNISRRHQLGLVAKRLESAAEMVRADARLHANQTRRQIREPCCHLAARPFLAPHDCARLESSFCLLCDFKELGVAKRPHPTTPTRIVSQRPLSRIVRADPKEPRPCPAETVRAARQDGRRLSDRTGFVIRIFGGADVAC